MYKIEYQFSLDIADKSLKERCERIGSPYPVLKGGAVHTLALSNLTEIPTKEETQNIIQTYKNCVVGKDMGKFIILDAHFDHIVSVVRMED